MRSKASHTEGTATGSLRPVPEIGLVDLAEASLPERLAGKVSEQLGVFVAQMREGLLAASVTIVESRSTTPRPPAPGRRTRSVTSGHWCTSALCRGGVAAVARAAGMSRSTVQTGARPTRAGGQALGVGGQLLGRCRRDLLNSVSGNPSCHNIAEIAPGARRAA